MHSSTRNYKKLSKLLSNPRMQYRLQHYINSNNLDLSGRISPSREEIVQNSDGVRRKSRKRKIGEKDEDFNPCDSDSSKSENYVNMCLRDVYSKIHTSARTSITPEDIRSSNCLFSKSANDGQLINITPKYTKSDFERRMNSSLHSEKHGQGKSDVIKNLSCPNDVKSGVKETPKAVLEYSKVKFSDVGGMMREKETLWEVLNIFKRPDDVQNFGPKGPCRILLHGPSGCGKTLLANAVAGELGLPLVKADLGDLDTRISGGLTRKLKELSECVISASPCILLIAKIDEVLAKKDNSQEGIVSTFGKCLDELSTHDSHVLVIGTTSQLESVDRGIRRQFEVEINIEIPNQEQRMEIFKIVSKDYNISADMDINELAKNTPSYVGGNFVQLLKRAVSKAFVRVYGTYSEYLVTQCDSLIGESIDLLSAEASVDIRKKKCLITEDFDKARFAYAPFVKSDGFARVPDVTWSDVGGLKELREEFEESILWPIKYKKLSVKFGSSKDAKIGILLCGPKGCGKTLIVKALANECSINFYPVSGPQLLNMYVGESERRIREVFQKARAASPCVLFFDEIDSICPSRSFSSDNGVSDRVVAQLLTEMDGIEDRKQVIVIGATNRPETIDSALLRPGRFGKVIYVDVPSSADRCDILRAITKNGTEPTHAAGVCLDNVAMDARCSGFSGADLSSLVDKARQIGFREFIMKYLKNPEEEPEKGIQSSHYDQAFCKVKSSITGKEEKFYEKMKSTIQNPVTLKKRRACTVTR